ncbi:hypothetical protein [Nocardiopsis sp. LOL_012]|uniref:hypothetical protein n=1 Tax=Nocardiopsis sp. LOL_012 TaxID=3345409 RepID=UPI003A85730A
MSIQPPDRRAEALEAIEQAEAERPRARPLVNAVVLVTGALTFTMAAWSAGHLVAQIPGVPTAYAWTAFAAIEGAWLACVLLMVLWQDDTARLFQFARAERLAKQVYWASLVLNFAHGLLLVGAFEVLPALLQPGQRFDAALTVAAGAGAGLLLCVFPYTFKELFAVAVSNRVDELRALRLDAELKRRYRLNALARLWPDQPHPGQPRPETAPAPRRTASGDTEAKADRVARVGELLQGRPNLTARELADELGVSMTSARRYRREARRAGQPWTDEDTAGHEPDQPSAPVRPSADEPDSPRPPERTEPDELSAAAADVSGPTELVRLLQARGVAPDDLVSVAVSVRPDIKPDSVRRVVRRLSAPAPA